MIISLSSKYSCNILCCYIVCDSVPVIVIHQFSLQSFTYIVQITNIFPLTPTHTSTLTTTLPLQYITYVV